MTSVANVKRAEQIQIRLASFKGALPGLAPARSIDTLAAQIVDSLRRIEFAHHIRDAKHSADRANPASPIFDPFRAAVLASREGNVDEAAWLAFLGTHFGKHQVDGWRLSREVYGHLQTGEPWTWKRICEDLDEFLNWMPDAVATMRADNHKYRFSNHRKYESLDHIGEVVQSYRAWLLPSGGLGEMVRSLHKDLGQDPAVIFDAVFNGMDAVYRFGRLAKFDYLTMLGKLGISPIEPGSPYLLGATGPLKGARLLFTGTSDGALSVADADRETVELGHHLGVGMQVMEDALCNWHKSPTRHIWFRG